VLYLKEYDIVFTNDYWRIAVEFDLSTYYDTMSTVTWDLLVMERQKREFTPMRELQQIGLILQTFESKLQSFNQFYHD
jgi:hypothetical protein